MKYEVVALSLGGLRKKTYKSGDIVDGAAFAAGKIPQLLAGKYIKERPDLGVSSPVYTPEVARREATADHPVRVIAFDNDGVFRVTTEAVKAKVKGDKSLNGCVVVIGYNLGNLQQVRAAYPSSKVIVYQLEQLADKNSLWWGLSNNGQNCKSWLENCDEIWDYAIENIEFLQRNGFDESKIKYVPISYSETYLIEEPDVLFYGFLNERRLELLLEASKHFNLIVIGQIGHDVKSAERFASLNIVPPKFGPDLWAYIRRVKVVLNIHYYSIQETVRLSELIANGVKVVTEKSKVNYFKGLVTEFDGAKDMVAKLKAAIKAPPVDLSAKFKAQRYPERRTFNPNGYNVLTIDTLSDRFKLFEKETLSKLDTDFGVYIGEADASLPWISFGKNMLTMLSRSFAVRDWTIIIEDDALITNENLRELEQAVERLEKNGVEWDIVFGCMACFEGRVIQKPFNDLNLYQVNFGISSVFNAYHKRALPVLSKWDSTEKDPHKCTFDSDFAKLGFNGELKLFTLFPYVAKCLPVPSDMWKSDKHSGTGYLNLFSEAVESLGAAIDSTERIQVYTCFTDGYDEHRKDVIFVPAEKDMYENAAKNAGRVKHLYWQYGITAPFNMWVDGSIYPLATSEQYIELLGEYDICLFQHPWRDCIYDEADETLRLDFDLPEIAEPQMKKYKKAGYPRNNGLGETGVLIRRDSKLVRSFFSALWKEIEAHSHRDQLAFNYVLSKFPKLRVKYLPPSVRTHPMFKMISHKRHVTAVDGKLIAK